MADNQQRTLTMTVKGTEYRLALDNIPVQTKFLVRQSTGFPYESFVDRGGEDSMVVMWWLARYLDGETKLTLAKALDDWSVLELGADDVEVEIDDGLPAAEQGSDSPQS